MQCSRYACPSRRINQMRRSSFVAALCLLTLSLSTVLNEPARGDDSAPVCLSPKKPRREWFRSLRQDAFIRTGEIDVDNDSIGKAQQISLGFSPAQDQDVDV